MLRKNEPDRMREGLRWQQLLPYKAADRLKISPAVASVSSGFVVRSPRVSQTLASIGLL